MLRSLKPLYGNKLRASDGDIGHVKDFYFDDQDWTIRYLVADTGTWLPGRQVLLSPHSVGRLEETEKILRVNLTRKQIEDSPSIESHKPVSRQYEEEYYRYYGWPYYWQGDAIWGMSGFPLLELPPNPLPNESSPPSDTRPGRADAHLRSTQSVNGYHFRIGEETIGHICDFMVDPESWAIGQLVIRTGHRISGKKVLVEAKNVNRISYEESAVFANPPAEGIEHGSAQPLISKGS